MLVLILIRSVAVVDSTGDTTMYWIVADSLMAFGDSSQKPLGE